jgi:hypothetical protein
VCIVCLYLCEHLPREFAVDPCDAILLLYATLLVAVKGRKRYFAGDVADQLSARDSHRITNILSLNVLNCVLCVVSLCLSLPSIERSFGYAANVLCAVAASNPLLHIRSCGA